MASSSESNRKRKCRLKPSEDENGLVTGKSPSGEELTLFYGHSCAFSNFFPSPFRLDGLDFVNGEQYFHYRKAKLFNDEEMAAAILATGDPRRHKALGRAVRNYKDDEWAAVDEGVMMDACRAKFVQSGTLRAALLGTRGRLVEASPRDRKWGVGLGIRNPDALDPHKWRGRNLLGHILTRLREELEAEIQEANS